MRESDVGCVQVPDSLFQQIRQQPGLLARLGSFVEVNIEFLCSEPLVFSVAMPEAFADLGPNMLSPESMQQAPMLCALLIDSYRSACPLESSRPSDINVDQPVRPKWPASSTT
jgi:hypothetical protein